MIHFVASPRRKSWPFALLAFRMRRRLSRQKRRKRLRTSRVDYLATMNPVISQLEALITRLDRQRAHIELSLMDQTRLAQEQEQLEQTYDLLFELRQIAATSLAVVQRLERELAQLKEQENGSGG